ncbi:MAG: OsmC family protein, partial [Candidatus Marinimicrobia bacterium]|nr:OsmC family protein [Candidatus Neomarinimicrobiota bacterium]
SHELAEAGYKPEKVDTTAQVHLDKVDGDFKITKIVLDSEAHVPDIEKEEFLKFAEGAKQGCPVSQALKSVNIELKAKLVN